MRRGILTVIAVIAASCLAKAEVKVTCRQSDPSIPPRGFGSVSFAVANGCAQEIEYRLEAVVTPPLRLVGAAARTLKVAGKGTEIAAFNIYAPQGTSAGGGVRLVVTDPTTGAQSSASCAFAVVPTPGFESRILSQTGEPMTVLSSTGETPGRCELVLRNTGNVPLKLTFESQCSPATARLGGCPAELTLLPAETRKLPLDLGNTRATNFTEAVAQLSVRATYDGNDLEPVQHFVRLQNYPDLPPVSPNELFKELSVTAGVAAGYSDSSPLLFQTLAVDGEIAPGTFLHFDGQLSTLSDPTVYLPGYEARSQFRLTLRADRWLIEGGEVRRSFGRILAAAERGQGINAEVKLSPTLVAGLYAAENTVTLSDAKTGGLSLAWQAAPHHRLELDIVGTQDDPDPAARDWMAAGVRWRYAPTKTFTFSLESAYGGSENGSGGAIGGSLLWRSELYRMPVELALEGGVGDDFFPGDQRGRTDGRVSLELRPLRDLRLNALYYRSEYKAPFFEQTVEELRSLTPDFQQRIASEATSLSATLEKPLPITLAYNESVSFQKALVDQNTRERALSLTVTRPNERIYSNVTLRGGTEERLGGDDDHSSRFASVSFDVSMPIATPRALVALNAAGRYTHNFDGDPDAVNRTGAWVNVGASVHNKKKTLGANVNVDAYTYDSGDSALRTRAGVHCRIAGQHEFGVEGAFTTHRGSQGGYNDSAVLFSYRYSFGARMPWMPHRGSAQGVIYNDLNANGRQDSGETGLPGMSVAVGKYRVFTDAKGAFRFPAMDPEAAPVAVVDPNGGALSFTQTPPEKANIAAGRVTSLAFGVAMPLRVDGEIEIARRNELLPEAEKSASIGIVATRQASGESNSSVSAPKISRSFTRGDGTFSIYLEPGTYVIRPESLPGGQTATPAEVMVTVQAGSPLPLPKFVVNDRSQEIKLKVFRQATN